MSEPRKKAQRRVFGRLTRMEAAGQERLLTFALTKAGLVVHRHACRKSGDKTLTFDRLAALAFGVKDGATTFTMTPSGVEVRHGRSAVTVSFPDLRNMAKLQPELFPL